MPSEPDTSVVVRPVQPAALRAAREGDCLPSDFDTSKAAACASAASNWAEAATQLATNGDWATLSQVLETRAAKQVLDRSLDDALGDVISRLTPAVLAVSPWVLCYQAMEHRICRGDYTAACQLGQAAVAQFARHGDDDGRARALSEVAIARYHLGQYLIALTELAICPLPEQPTCAAALLLATYLNQLGTGALSAAITAAHRGLQLIERERELLRRTNWRTVLQRNLVVAYHYQGELGAARRAAEEALVLAKPYDTNRYDYPWGLYEQGVLEQRAGRLELALMLLRRARERVEQSSSADPLWRWIVVAEGHALRDSGQLAAADERYRLGGWGEGDEGPLMLWLLQGGHMEARLAVEARLAAAHASGSPFEVTNLTVFLALLDLEAGATRAIHATLDAAAEHYAALGFRHQRASVQFHLAAVAYALDRPGLGDQVLSEALTFGAASGYLNFSWWYPARMQLLLQHALQAGIMVEYAVGLLRERGLIAQPDADHIADAPAIPAAAPNGAVLTLRCLGDFVVWVDGELLPKKRWQGHRAGAIRMQRLLLFLARNREPQSIEAIVRYVWPDIWKRIDVSTNFHLTLAGLRRVFEPELDQGSASRFVLTTPQGYQLRPDLAVIIDLDQFLEHLRRARLADPAGDAELPRLAFAQAEQLYSGDFALAKPDPGEAEEYHRAALEALCWLANDDLHRGACDSCIARARRLLREDSWNSTGSALLIAAYLQRGNRRAARQHYERFVQMHGQPSSELLDLARAHWL
jgi:DNA-binding SARP family transcriptional activator